MGEQHGSPKEHIIGNGWADEIARAARSRLVGNSCLEVSDAEGLSSARKVVRSIAECFERVAKGTFADRGALGFEPRVAFEGHDFQALHGEGVICSKCGTIA